MSICRTLSYALILLVPMLTRSASNAICVSGKALADRLVSNNDICG
jgi:hypothetical protein